MEDKFIDRLFKELDKQGIPKTKFYSDLNISRTTILNWKKDSQPLTGTFLKITNTLMFHRITYGLAKKKNL